MTTFLYMIRHAESPYVAGNERLRGLSVKGKQDARQIDQILRHEGIDVFVSSPYTRAIDTILLLAEAYGQTILEYEELRERPIASLDVSITELELLDAVEQSFTDLDFKLEGGESTREAQERAVPVIKQLLKKHAGSKIAVGTHGNIMTIIMNYFDSDYGFAFWKSTSKPDIYKLEFEEEQLKSVKKLWE